MRDPSPDLVLLHLALVRARRESAATTPTHRAQPGTRAASRTARIRALAVTHRAAARGGMGASTTANGQEDSASSEAC